MNLFLLLNLQLIVLTFFLSNNAFNCDNSLEQNDGLESDEEFGKY